LGATRAQSQWGTQRENVELVTKFFTSIPKAKKVYISPLSLTKLL
jgi:hypothetical protein